MDVVDVFFKQRIVPVQFVEKEEKAVECLNKVKTVRVHVSRALFDSRKNNQAF